MTSLRTRDRMLTRLREQGIKDEVVLSAIAAIPRHIFVDEALSIRAYEDVSLPIGFGQTISQPYIVARMSEILRNGNQLNKVLEIGTGCGYQTAVLSKLAKEVYSVERIRPLVMKARGHLRELKCVNVKLGHADGNLGLPDLAPFDGIIVTAAASHMPQDLLDQLAIGGRLVIPVGTEEQILYLVERVSQTEYRQTKLESVKFVPLLGGTS
ncbi:protein-L-isoaspartate(D-aspartate) O-methyltransferase [Methylotenera sp.]|uniref:protein-L-isoaspartate(D-aspartate) O-methyltransferase n=1 Tax=Methylotenera sp. TaxID=2051956 RepID=UPI002723B4C8|nr:protein-L-isoaspartate(D-aspartate) O-methyltransferase [Methylotenera sp.]MDO9205477.1 protein-L-isoaspartate(D-aspartate) O-methyltransferase [Methylotenera sp.]MDO9393028.1 protein-L-isoaspartate(D-aspartate) O-methyltransferase [Methylotenera sp.]MDP1522121.1 protein-L-isoaspartate(D-aspartate) O-methyltransferase [Methylotenera sp.]MDP2072330.1 protein-L-isoaspartate(D-aspartate) O-methyltransferase [Methylotenera sp.]MDP2231085.1 protein-L-isoaspartate(D-aspartate) O-methyltransferase